MRTENIKDNIATEIKKMTADKYKEIAEKYKNELVVIESCEEIYKATNSYDQAVYIIPTIKNKNGEYEYHIIIGGKIIQAGYDTTTNEIIIYNETNKKHIIFPAIKEIEQLKKPKYLYLGIFPGEYITFSTEPDIKVEEIEQYIYRLWESSTYIGEFLLFADKTFTYISNYSLYTSLFRIEDTGLIYEDNIEIDIVAAIYKTFYKVEVD